MLRLRAWPLIVVTLIGITADRVQAGQQITLPETEETTETNRAPIIPFLEGTDVFWTVVKKDAVDSGPVYFPNKLEANIFPHLVVFQDFTDVLNLDRQAEKAQQGKGVKQFALVVSGTPAVRIRMLWDPLESTCRHASLSIL